MTNLLEIKNQLKARKPDFVRTDFNKKRFKNKWRKPRGLHNKLRLNKKGHQKKPSSGYGSPKKLRSLHKSGLELIRINALKDLTKLNKENQAAVLSSKLGMKLKLRILDECTKNKIKVFNIKNIEAFILDSKLKLDERKRSKKKKKEKKEKTKEEAEKKAEKKAEKPSEEKQEEIKEKVLEAKQELKQKIEKEVIKKDPTQAKAGHLARSVPGSKQ